VYLGKMALKIIKEGIFEEEVDAEGAFDVLDLLD
jgi:hypothetical protein